MICTSLNIDRACCLMGINIPLFDMTPEIWQEGGNYVGVASTEIFGISVLVSDHDYNKQPMQL